jgi:hypothetical protein
VNILLQVEMMGACFVAHQNDVEPLEKKGSPSPSLTDYKSRVWKTIRTLRRQPGSCARRHQSRSLRKQHVGDYVAKPPRAAIDHPPGGGIGE